MNSKLAVKTERLVKTFSGDEVIKGCSLSIPAGCIYGLIGVNGAGKTTLFKLLMGLLAPTAGRVRIFGMDVSEHRDEVMRHIGSIIETPIFYDHLSARSNLEIHLEYMGLTGDIPAALNMVGLTSINNQPVSKFSLGMRQRLGIARAVIHKPKLLILDEPINGLDPLGIREMRELFLTLKTKFHMTILISSHILGEVELTADTVGVLVNGVIAQEVTPSVVQGQYPNGLEDYFFNIMAERKRDV